MPYAIAAKLDAPERPVVALVGDGAMQMSGLLELITVADRWRQWSDPRFVVLVLHNGDLAEVSWEQREMEGDPRFATSQAVPAFPYAHYAELLGLRGIPVLIEAIVDPAVPLVPPNMPDEKADKVFHAISGEDDDAPADHLARQRADDQRVSR
jgi:pyruvate dehydrogenase (quinone)